MFLPAFLLPPALRPKLPGAVPALGTEPPASSPSWREANTAVALQALRDLPAYRHARHVMTSPAARRCAVGEMAHALGIPLRSRSTETVVRELAARTTLRADDLYRAMYLNDLIGRTGPQIAAWLEKQA